MINGFRYSSNGRPFINIIYPLRSHFSIIFNYGDCTVAKRLNDYLKTLVRSLTWTPGKNYRENSPLRIRKVILKVYLCIMLNIHIRNLTVPYNLFIL